MSCGKMPRVKVCFLLLALLACGIGIAQAQKLARMAYSGVGIANADAVSEGIRTVLKHRSKRAIVQFKAQTLDRNGLRTLADGLVENALYESEDPCGGDYLRFQMGGYELRHSVGKGLFRYVYTIKLSPHYYTTAEQEAAVDERVQEIIAGFAFHDKATDEKKARAVHTFLCDTVRYDTVHKKNPDSHIKTTAYAALFYHTAVCQGYAVTAYRLLKELGVDTRIVTGTAEVDGKRERHAWNIVRINGRYYNMDTTLDAVSGTDDYFLKTEDAFAVDHERDAEYQTAAFQERYPGGTESFH